METQKQPHWNDEAKKWEGLQNTNKKKYFNQSAVAITHTMEKENIKYLRHLAELNKTKNKPLFLALRDVAIARDKLLKAIAKTKLVTFLMSKLEAKPFLAGDFLQIKDTHECFVYVKEFDTENSVVRAKDGEIYVLRNEWLQKDWDRIFINYVTNKIKALWTKLLSKARLNF